MFGFIKRIVTGRKTRKDSAILLAALQSDRYEFRSKTALAKKIGTTPDSTYFAELIGTIGVRGMYGNPDMIGLVNRIGATPRRFASN